MPAGLLICPNRDGFEKKNLEGVTCRKKKTSIPLVAVGPEATSPL